MANEDTLRQLLQLQGAGDGEQVPSRESQGRRRAIWRWTWRPNRTGRLV